MRSVLTANESSVYLLVRIDDVFGFLAHGGLCGVYSRELGSVFVCLILFVSALSFASIFVLDLQICRDIPLVLSFYLGYKFIKKTKLVPLHDIPITQALYEAENDVENVPVRTSKWSRFNIIWG